MLDKDISWGLNRGLGMITTSVLNMARLPFILTVGHMHHRSNKSEIPDSLACSIRVLTCLSAATLGLHTDVAGLA